MNKKIVILGGGESGVGAALLAIQKGYDVFLSDGSSLKELYRKELTKANIAFEEGGHDEAIILNADEVVKSPGIPESSAMMKKIRSAGIPVISEIELAYRYAGESLVIAITGSNEKRQLLLLFIMYAKLVDWMLRWLVISVPRLQGKSLMIPNNCMWLK
jgi:UDP-N-acetylmuramoylalanine--D-glutamate ligase